MLVSQFKQLIAMLSLCLHLNLHVLLCTFKTVQLSYHKLNLYLVVGRRTCDLVVAGLRPGHDAAV